MLMNQRNILPFGLSAISIWEVTLKARKRKLELLPIDATIARLANELPGTFHEDPADRLIAATALQLNLAVVTSDMNFRSYDAVRSIW